jgi:hypothetical protein
VTTVTRLNDLLDFESVGLYVYLLVRTEPEAPESAIG